MVDNQPSVTDPGHGPLSSKDEAVGGLAGAAIGGLATYEKTGNGLAALGVAALGWKLGEEAIDYSQQTEY